MIDKLGRELNEGDLILYARTVGRSADMTFGRIVKIVEKKIPAVYGRYNRVIDNPNEYIRGLGLDPLDPAVKLEYHAPVRTTSLSSDHPETFWWSFYNPNEIRTKERSEYTITVDSVQGFSFTSLDDDMKGTFNNARITRVRLQYPDRMLKLDGFKIPEFLEEFIETNAK